MLSVSDVTNINYEVFFKIYFLFSESPLESTLKVRPFWLVLFKNSVLYSYLQINVLSIYSRFVVTIQYNKNGISIESPEHPLADGKSHIKIRLCLFSCPHKNQWCGYSSDCKGNIMMSQMETLVFNFTQMLICVTLHFPMRTSNIMLFNSYFQYM